METFLEILKYTIPSIIVFLIVFFLFRSYFIQDQKKMLIGLKDENKKITIPLLLQAYERMTLFLERISMNNLLIRVNRPGMTAHQLHAALLQSINEEFAHNLSQQLYTTDKTWEMIRKAKEETILFINSTAAEFTPDKNAGEMAARLLTKWAENGNNAIQKAMGQLKKEVRDYF